jgi:hypothetical protein
LSLIERIHFDEDHRSNRNIRVNNKDVEADDCLQFYDDGWSDCDKNYGTGCLFDHGFNLLKSNILKHSDEFKKQFVGTLEFQHSKMWYDVLHDNQDEITKVQDKIYNLLLEKHESEL